MHSEARSTKRTSSKDRIMVAALGLLLLFSAYLEGKFAEEDEQQTTSDPVVVVAGR